jgi:hydroxyacid-oxoacid transhydrogenase
MSVASFTFRRLPSDFGALLSRFGAQSCLQRRITSLTRAIKQGGGQCQHSATATHPPGCCCPQHRAMAIGLQTQQVGDPVFAIEATSIRFGPGSLLELGAAVSSALHSLQSTRSSNRGKIALFTDANVRLSPWYQEAEYRLRQALPTNAELDVWDKVLAEPTLKSLHAPSQWLHSVQADVIVSIGGGSVIDTAKACSLLSATFPFARTSQSLDMPPEAEFLTYFNAPVGGARWPVDAYGSAAKLRPHIACPTTAGTGSECTGIAIFDVEHLRVKAGIAHPHLRPSLAIIDPITQTTTSPAICASTGFDVLSHAIESYTALPHTERRGVISDPNQRFISRPMSQGSNEWADSGCITAMSIVAQNIVAACDGDMAARGRMMLASTLAGIAFGNVGVHLPHAMSYAVSGGLPRDYNGPGYGTYQLIGVLL